MARPLRIEFPGAVYHITSRGNERKAIFRDDKDRKMFLDTLKDVTLRYNWLCHAYCLMENHYHLLIDTPDGNLSIGMRQLNGIYTQRFNKRHGRAGISFKEGLRQSWCRRIVIFLRRADMWYSIRCGRKGCIDLKNGSGVVTGQQPDGRNCTHVL